MWVDAIPLSRPKRNISRDFADGVLFAEVVKHYFPKLVELHNYSAAHGVSQKLYNWRTLNQKVLRRLGLKLDAAEMDAIARAEPGYIEVLLVRLMKKMEKHKKRATSRSAGSASGDRDRSNRDSRPAPSDPYRASPEPSRRGVPDPYDDRDAGRDQQEYSPPPQGDQRAQGGSRPLNLDAGTVDTELLVEKERTIIQMREIIKVLERKMMKLEKLVELKNEKIQSLQSELARRP